MRILLTGAAGFIGMHVAERLLARGDEVIGLDNLNDYYSVQLKQDRLARLQSQSRFRFVKAGVEDRAAVVVDAAGPGVIDVGISEYSHGAVPACVTVTVWPAMLRTSRLSPPSRVTKPSI
jgi:nucleoside-diphosphate-sugar epimerase